MTSSTAGHTAVVGQYAIARSEYGWDLILVQSVTPKQFKGVKDKGWKSTVSADKLVFCGEEATARQLYEQLVSSRAMCTEERQKAYGRRIIRDDELIAKATGAA